MRIRQISTLAARLGVPLPLRLAGPFFLALPVFVAASAAAELRIDLVSGYEVEAGGATNGDSVPADVSPDGRFLLITSQASHLVPGFADDNSAPDALVLDRQSGAFDYVSVAAGGARSGERASTAIAVSDDGRWVFFASQARDLVAGASYPALPSRAQLFLFDRVARITRLVSHAPGNPLLAGNDDATGIRLSADGRFALFTSAASNLASPPSSGIVRSQVYLFDRDGGGTRLVSHAAGAPAVMADGPSSAADLSADGAIVLFESSAPDLLAGLSDALGNDVFAYDRAKDSLELISRRADNPATSTGGKAYDLSADGRFVLLGSSEVSLVAALADGNGSLEDVFVFDRQSGAARLASPAATVPATSANSSSAGYRLSDDGRYAYFTSYAQNLVSPFIDNNLGWNDFYVFDSVSGMVTLASHLAGTTTQGSNARVAGLAASQAAVSPDGRHALYEAFGTGLELGVTDANNVADLYLYDREAGTSTLVSRRGASQVAGTVVPGSGLLLSGGETFFASLEPLDPAAADPHPQRDVFRFDPTAAAASLETRNPASFLSSWPNGSGAGGVLTPNGRFVTWSGYVWDRLTGVAERVAHAAGNPAAPANAPAASPGITPDGRFVLLETIATNLVAGVTDANIHQNDAFVYDRNVDAAFLISHAAGQPARTGNGGSSLPGWLSADARQFVLHSKSSDLVAGQSGAHGYFNLFFYDRPAAGAELISHHHASLTRCGDGASIFHDISADTRFVVFQSGSYDLIPGFVDANDFWSKDSEVIRVPDLYFYDRALQQAILVSHPPGLPNQGAIQAAPSNAWLAADEQSVFYTLTRSTETEVGPSQVFRWDRASNSSTRMTEVGGAPFSPCGDAASLADLTADGRLLLITTPCAFAPGDTNGEDDVYLIDRQAGAKTLISHQPGNPAIATGGAAADLSADGRRAIYLDGAGVPHSYDRASGQATRLTSAHFDPSLPVPATVVGASADGSHVLVATQESQLVPGDGNDDRDLFLITLADLFADGFESGSTGRWSQTLP